MPTATVSITPASLRLRQTFTSLPFTSNTINQSEEGDTEVTLTVYFAGQVSAYIQLLFQDSNGEWDSPSAAAAHAVVYGPGRFTILPPFKLPGRSFKVAIFLATGTQSVNGLLEVWGNKWKIET